jgi:hypothetical protein
MSQVKIKISYDSLDSLAAAALREDIKTWKYNVRNDRNPEDIERNRARIEAAKFLLKDWYEQ